MQIIEASFINYLLLVYLMMIDNFKLNLLAFYWHTTNLKVELLKLRPGLQRLSAGDKIHC